MSNEFKELTHSHTPRHDHIPASDAVKCPMCQDNGDASAIEVCGVCGGLLARDSLGFPVCNGDHGESDVTELNKDEPA